MARERLTVAEQTLAMAVLALAAAPVVTRDRWDAWVDAMAEARPDCDGTHAILGPLCVAADAMAARGYEGRDDALWMARKAAERFAEWRAGLAQARLRAKGAA